MTIENNQINLFDDADPTNIVKTGGEPFKNGNMNKLQLSDRPFHNWYRFVLSYPPHLVRRYIDDFGLKVGETLLDPFCGTGTTLVEGKLRRLRTVGIEANPIAHFAASVKTNWDINPDVLKGECENIAKRTNEILALQNINDLQDCSDHLDKLQLKTVPDDAEKLLLKNSISPLPLHKSLLLLQEIRKNKDRPFYNHALLALAKTLVYDISNLKFGPEVGVGKIKRDAPVVLSWLQEIRRMASDLKAVSAANYFESKVFLGDARRMNDLVEEASIDAVITSPPYPNEKDYTRTTRLESVILGFVKDRKELQSYKKTLIRSNTRGVYKSDDDDKVIEQFPDIMAIANEIENRRVAMNKTSGFERAYARVTKLYFGGMYKHLQQLSLLLKPGAQVAYVVGDQASYLRVMIRTGELLVQIAESLGYKHVRTDLFRTRLATATGEQLREEVVILKWGENDE